MKWKDAYATGVQRLDEQHMMIFNTADDFRTALDEGVGESVYPTLLDFLFAYCEGHFRFEEGCMEEHRCPVAQKNKAAHTMFLATFRDYRLRYETRGYQAEDARALIDKVDRWLDEHICRIDVHLKKCVNK